MPRAESRRLNSAPPAESFRQRSHVNRRSGLQAIEHRSGKEPLRRPEATRLLAIQELAWRESSTIETLVGSLGEVVAKFDGVFEKVIPRDVEQAAFMEWLPSQVYRKTSEVLLGKTLFHKLFGYHGTSRPSLDLLLSRQDLPLEDWMDTDDPELLARVAAVFDRIEDQLQDNPMPPPPDTGPEPDDA